MNRAPTLLGWLVCLLGFSSTSWAAELCEKPRPRDTAGLREAIALDEAMGDAFSSAEKACQTSADACDSARLSCQDALTLTLRKQMGFDEGAYLRDMLILFQGQQYRMSIPIPSAGPLTDVACGAEPTSLAQAAQRRKVQAARRKLLLSEYPKWAQWTSQQAQTCVERAQVEDTRAKQNAERAASLAASAEIARRAEAERQETARKAEAERQEIARKAETEQRKRIEAEERARKEREDAAEQARKQQVDAVVAAQRAQQKAEEEAKEKIEAQKRAEEDAVEKAKKDAQRAEEDRLVKEREDKKDSAKKRHSELLAQEEGRQKEVAAQREAERARLAQTHERKVEELKRNLALSEEQRQAELAAEDQRFDEAEVQRRAKAMSDIEAAGTVDDSDERTRGNLGAHGAAGYFSLANTSAAVGGPLVGGQVRLRQAFWGTAPSSGMAAGVELRGSALFLTSVGSTTGGAQLIALAPEFRYWFGRVALGGAFEYSRLSSTVGTSTLATETLGLGPSLSIAAVDTPHLLLILSAKWLPILSNQIDRLGGEIEAAWEWFSLGAQAGLLKTSTGDSGWFVGAALGARLKW